MTTLHTIVCDHCGDEYAEHDACDWTAITRGGRVATVTRHFCSAPCLRASLAWIVEFQEAADSGRMFPRKPIRTHAKEPT